MTPVRTGELGEDIQLEILVNGHVNDPLNISPIYLCRCFNFLNNSVSYQL